MQWMPGWPAKAGSVPNAPASESAKRNPRAIAVSLNTFASIPLDQTMPAPRPTALRSCALRARHWLAR